MNDTAGNKAACFYAGRRINFHVLFHYQQRFRLTDFFSTFVRAEKSLNAQPSPMRTVTCHLN